MELKSESDTDSVVILKFIIKNKSDSNNNNKF